MRANRMRKWKLKWEFTWIIQPQKRSSQIDVFSPLEKAFWEVLFAKVRGYHTIGQNKLFLLDIKICTQNRKIKQKSSTVLIIKLKLLIKSGTDLRPRSIGIARTHTIRSKTTFYYSYYTHEAHAFASCLV